jgi:co-chaperonin GroES (HSP10)
VTVIKKFTPILDHIIVTNINFGEQKTASGIVLRSDNGTSEGVKPRWGQIYALGPDCSNLTVGEWVLIEHGRWTRGINLTIEDTGEELELFRIDPNGILIVADQKPDDLEFGSFTTPTSPGMTDFVC